MSYRSSGAFSSITRSPAVLFTSMITKRNPRDIPGDKISPGVFMTSANAKYKRQIVRAGIGLIGREEQKWLVRALFDFHLRDGRTHPLHVSGKRVFEKVLAGSIQPFFPCFFRARQKRVPGELVNLLVAFSPPVRHQNRNIVAGVADVMIQQQTGRAVANICLHRFSQPLGWGHVAAD